ncbi:MAG: hypothetical protein AAF267_15160, partial [Deinococcota bacterium]
SYEHKWLCCISPDGTSERIVPWDNSEEHLIDNIACWAPDNTLIRAFKVYSPHFGKGDKRLERLDLTTGNILWATHLSTTVTSLALVDNKYVAYALNDGHIGLVDVASGTILDELALVMDGVPTVAMSLAACNSQLAVGTIDARLLLFEVG